MAAPRIQDLFHSERGKPLFGGVFLKKSTPIRQYQVLTSRDPAAQFRDKASLIDLGTDIVTIIIDYVQDTSPSSLGSITLVCQWLHNIGRYSQHRNLVLKVPTGGDENILGHLQYIESQELLPAIQHVELRGARSLLQATATTFTSLLPRMTGLRTLSLPDVPLWEELLDVLKTLPRVELHVSAPEHYYSSRRQTTNLACLPFNTNLVSLSFIASYHSFKESQSLTQPLKHVLLTCPNLRRLELDLDLPRSGCMIIQPPRQYCGLGFVNGERPPALEVLILRGYPFGSEPPDPADTQQSAYISNRIGYPLSGREEDYWADVFDWSRLKRLIAPNGDFALKLMPRLTNLEEISFALASDKEKVNQFCVEVPAALRAIHVPRNDAISLEGIIRHAQSLVTLWIHQKEDYQGEWRKDAITADELGSIRDHCRLIEELSVDIARHETFPESVFNVLASFPQLRKLELWFELGLDNCEEPLRPYVTFSAVASMFKYLREASPKQPSALETLVVHSGSPPDIGHGLPSPEAFWPGEQSMTFYCTLSERDDEAAQGLFYVSCPGILTAKSSEVEEVIEQARERVRKNDQTVSNELNVAVNGPRPLGTNGVDWDDCDDDL